MGNGSSASRPSSTVVVRPAETNQTSFPSARSIYDQTSHHRLSNGVTHVGHNPTLQPSCPQQSEFIELDNSIEIAAAPQGISHYQFSQESSSKADRNSQSKHTRQQVLPQQQPRQSSDEMVFEVYRSFAGGQECTVLNDEGTRFYLDSWETGEWQPFPEEWLNYGCIETQNRNTMNTVAVSTSDILLDNDDHRNEDDERTGVLDHPLKGELMTYIMDEQCHVHCVFDPSSGAWLKLPLSWELHSPHIATMIHTIQQTLPDWKDEYEILALLRQCNYDVDETIATYLSLLENDFTWRHQGIDRSGPSQEEMDAKCRETRTLKKQIALLESKLLLKENELSIQEHKLHKQNDLKEKLEMKELLITQLEIKLSCLESELEEARKELEETVNLQQSFSSHALRAPSPKQRKISTETVFAVKVSLSYLSNSTKQLKGLLLEEKESIQMMFNSAIAGINELKSRNESSDGRIVELRRLYNHEALHRRLLYNKVQELNGNIRVFCRCRFDQEAKMAVGFPSQYEVKTKTLSGDKTFMFDRIFTPSTTQEQVFEDTLPLITSCVDGYNVCIMAYGQTGSGKTYTMMGPDNNPGVNIRSVKELLRICKQRENVEYTLTVSMLEVYNESLRDLLSDNVKSQLNIYMKGKVVVVNDLTEIQVNSEDSITKIMTRGNANRSVGETKMNTNSSRSHLVLILNIKGVNLISNSISHGTLTLVDLAGSERISKTEATGQRLVEAAAINKSLSALGQVFTALRTNAMHVPYRNSKLTQLLQGALGGDGKACMFVNISPAESNLSETLSTLNFGSAAKQVQLGKPVQNIRKLPK